MINSIFFAPSAWNMPYYLGCWRAMNESSYLNNIKYLYGGSSGSIVSFSFAADLDLDEVEYEVLSKAKKYSGFKCWTNMSKIVRDYIDHFFTPHLNWRFEPYALVTTFEKKWPILGPRFVKVDDKKNIENIKSLILSSCYIPLLYEDIPKLNNKIVIDGGLFLMNLNLPNILNVSPYLEMSPNSIGYEKNSIEDKLINCYYPKSLFPDIEYIQKIKNAGYKLTKKWLYKYA